jgi:hypothetical protein
LEKPYHSEAESSDAGTVVENSLNGNTETDNFLQIETYQTQDDDNELLSEM